MTENSEVILIKLGGSIITDKKGGEAVLNEAVVGQLCQEIARAKEESGAKIVISHGAGSFAHPPAAKYRTMEGVVDDSSLMGASEVRQAMMDLSTQIIKKLFQAGLPAISLPPVAFITSRDKQLDNLFPNAIVNLLRADLLPVVYGDVISDSKLGFTIFSGERVLNMIALHLGQFNLIPRLVIEVGDTDGVYRDLTKKDTIPVISKENFTEVESKLQGSSGVDVTGGMAHKVKEAYELAQEGIPTLLISSHSGNLRKAILGQEVTGTRIKY